MSLYITQCPHCKMTFKTDEEQLAVANGKVRCGSCMNVFFAPDNLVMPEEDTPARQMKKADPQAMSELENEYLAQLDEEDIELESISDESTDEPLITSDSESIAQPATQAEAEAEAEAVEEPKTEHSNLATNNLTDYENNVTSQTEQITTEQTATEQIQNQQAVTLEDTIPKINDTSDTAQETEALDESQINEPSSAKDEPELIDEPSATLANTESSNEQPKLEIKQEPVEPENTPEEEQLDSESASSLEKDKSDSQEDINPEEEAIEAPKSEQNDYPEDDSILPLDEMDELNIAQSHFSEDENTQEPSKRWQESDIVEGSPVDDVYSLIKTDLRDNDERKEPNAFSSVMPLNTDDEESEPPPEQTDSEGESELYGKTDDDKEESDEQEDKPSTKSATGFWTFASLILILGLIGQVAYFNFDTFSRHPDTRFLYQKFCQLTGCELPSVQDTKKMVVQQLLVRKQQDGAYLQADILLINKAIYNQPYPDLTLIIRSNSGQVLASRRFSPKEYLSYRASLSDTLMPKGIPVRARVIVKTPEGERASESVHILANQ